MQTWIFAWKLAAIAMIFTGRSCVGTTEENEKNEKNEKNDIAELYRALRDRVLSLDGDLPEKFFHQPEDEEPEFTNEWAIQVAGGHHEANRVSRELGYENMGQIRGFENMYLFRRRDVPERHKRDAGHHTVKLVDDPNVLWAEQQRTKRRIKRDFGTQERTVSPKNVDLLFNDPLWPKQWPLHDTRVTKDIPKLDLHVIGAWRRGYTGKGVSVTILDDGIQWNHPDLQANYDPNASYDLNDNDTDPMPTMNDFNRHGTRCAGEVAMIANNHICGVGIAFNAKIGGIRMLDGRITDRLEAEALQFNINHVDVYSASWGPNDDGKTVEGPGKLAQKAIENGIKNGRGGKGVIYVWASGNGGTFGDDCDCDGYTDSIFTLSVSSAAQSGQFPWYGEKCASTIATTYSSGAYTDQKITTTDLGGECTTDHTGTSASAPLAAGIVALGLEANPNVTWRDVQHLVIWTAEPAPLLHNPDWHKNGRGLWANTRFGFGLMNAEEFAATAVQWINVPEQKICTTFFPDFKMRKFNHAKPGIIKFRTDACQGQENLVKYLEHLQVVTDIDYTRRGNLAIFLISPKGTKTQLLAPRKRDKSKSGFRRWPFMSVHTWGEDPAGWWTLEVHDEVGIGGQDYGAVTNLTLILYGTTEMPLHYKKERIYNMNYNEIHDRSLKRSQTQGSGRSSSSENPISFEYDYSSPSVVEFPPPTYNPYPQNYKAYAQPAYGWSSGRRWNYNKRNLERDEAAVMGDVIEALVEADTYENTVSK